MKILLILILLTSCASRVKITKTQPEDYRTRVMDCIIKFHELGKIHADQMDACKFIFKKE